MKQISILDCTLRDGGYINNWNFGSVIIRNITEKITQSNIDIIECGFLRDVEYDVNCAVYNDVHQIIPFISPKKPDIMYVGMIAVGDISADKITPYDGLSIDGIRLTFHKHEWDEVRATAVALMKKGYKVFIQPVGTTGYSDRELLELVEKVNELKPFAFYIVDTLGTMYRNGLLHTFYIVENNLDSEIVIGYHSHNNLQLAFSNAQALMTLNTRRNLILDASVFGMGRAAGNLCTELITQYINVNLESRYNVTPLLEIVDDYLIPIFNNTPWGYSVPYYLSAIGNIHPDYSTYLINKQTISIKSIGTILNQIPSEKRSLYDQSYIEMLYLKFQQHEINDIEPRKRLSKLIDKRPVLIIAPGKTIRNKQNEINSFIDKHNPFIITINFVSDEFPQDIAFISNMKRFDGLMQLTEQINSPIVVTSNIMQNPISEQFLPVNYTSLLGNEAEADNSGIMLIHLLEDLGVSVIFLAGFDGFSSNIQDNYYSQELINSVERSAIIQKNAAIVKHLNRIRERLKLVFVTPSYFEESQ